MILLDTDHLSVLSYRDNPRGQALHARLRAAADAVAVTAITVEEQVRGWLGRIRSERNRRKLVRHYQQFLANFAFLANWPHVGFDEPALAVFEQLTKARVRIGSQDLKIAAIAIAK